jgi:calcineurin-like phosphoesterase family protein
MDEELIKRFNSIVQQDDITIHVGDFTLKRTEEAERYIQRLNGKHIFIKGSHDNWNKELPYMLEKRINGKNIVACHYAMRVWPKSHYGSTLVYGHSHGRLTTFENAWDVGVDNNNYYPVPFDELFNKIKTI